MQILRLAIYVLYMCSVYYINEPRKKLINNT